MGPLSRTIVHETDIEDGSPCFIDFEGPQDQDLPLNWTFLWKVWVTFVVAFLNLIGTVASSIFGTGSYQFMKIFNISHKVAVLGTTLFLSVGSHLLPPVLFLCLSEDRVS